MTFSDVLGWAFTAYLVVTGIYIVSENRRPSATFGWMLLFALLPGAGVLLYILFGRKLQTFGHTGHIEQQDLLGRLPGLMSDLRAQHEGALRKTGRMSTAGEKLANLVRNTSHSTLTTHNRAQILQDAREAYPSLLRDIENARASIHLQYFSWASDELGERLKELLAAKVAEGVEVRVLYDPVGALLMLRRRYVREMRALGIRMEPVSKLWRVHTISYRNHRKIAVLDGVIGHTGGLNIGCEHLDPPRGFARWRDTNLRIEGAAAQLLQAVFVIDWHNATGEDLLVKRYFPPVPEDTRDADLPVQVTLSGPDSQWQAIRQLYFAMIVAARDHVYLQTPFFILDASLTTALKAAALSGVDVRVMISERGASQHVPHWAANTYMEEIAAAGATVLLYRGGYLHAKTVSTDSSVCSIGSANIDIRSFSINYELNAVVYDEALTRELEAAFLRDMDDCVEFTVEDYHRRGILLRFRDSVARLFSPLL